MSWVGIERRGERTDGRTDGRTEGHTNFDFTSLRETSWKTTLTKFPPRNIPVLITFRLCVRVRVSSCARVNNWHAWTKHRTEFLITIRSLLIVSLAVIFGLVHLIDGIIGIDRRRRRRRNTATASWPSILLDDEQDFQSADRTSLSLQVRVYLFYIWDLFVCLVKTIDWEGIFFRLFSDIWRSFAWNSARCFCNTSANNTDLSPVSIGTFKINGEDARCVDATEPSPTAPTLIAPNTMKRPDFVPTATSKSQFLLIAYEQVLGFQRRRYFWPLISSFRNTIKRWEKNALEKVEGKQRAD